MSFPEDKPKNFSQTASNFLEESKQPAQDDTTDITYDKDVSLTNKNYVV